MAAELGLEPGEVILDFPVKKAMFQLDVLVDRPDGVVRLGREGISGMIDLPKLGQELYRTARVLRLFTFERREVDPERLLERLPATPAASKEGPVPEDRAVAEVPPAPEERMCAANVKTFRSATAVRPADAQDAVIDRETQQPYD
jgi:hypothetical protein